MLLLYYKRIIGHSCSIPYKIDTAIVMLHITKVLN